MDEKIRLVSSRVYLRPFRMDDFESLREVEGDPEVLRYRSRKLITEEMTRDFLQRAPRMELENPSRYPFAICLRSSDLLIGQCGLTLFGPKRQDAYLWFSINRRYWNQGYATEAVRAALRFAFRSLGLQSVFAECLVDNQASLHVLHKLGMHQEPLSIEERNDPLMTGRMRFRIFRPATSILRRWP